MTALGAFACLMAGLTVLAAVLTVAQWVVSLRRRAGYWSRFEATMDTPASALVILRECERAKAAYTDGLLRRGFQQLTIEETAHLAGSIH